MGDGGAGARQTAAQLDSFANSKRRGEKGGCGILGPAWPAPCLAGCSNRDSEPAAAPRPASPPGLSAPRSPPPAPSARTHALANFSPLPGSPLPLRSPSPLPLLSKPRHQRRRRHTRRSEGRASSRAPRAHTHLLQPARPLPGPKPAPQAPEPRARLTARRPDSPGCKETFLGPPAPPTMLWADAAASASRPGHRPGGARLRVPSPGAPSSGPSRARRRHLRVMSSLWDKCCGLPCLRRDIAPASILASPGELH